MAKTSFLSVHKIGFYLCLDMWFDFKIEGHFTHVFKSLENEVLLQSLSKLSLVCHKARNRMHLVRIKLMNSSLLA